MDDRSQGNEHLPIDGAIGLLRSSGGWRPTSIAPVRVLGHGRAAEARLVKATDKDGKSRLCVEKVFCPGLLTRTIYRAAFLAPFAYQDNADAIEASFYRRRVAAAIIKTFAPEVSVAQPLYVRWDRQSQAMVLSSEFIRGRGINPAPTNARMIRNRIAGLFTRSARPSVEPSAEIDQLLAVMTKIEDLLVTCGLTGSGWQVCKRAMVSTANLLRTENGYVVVDLESGIPSVLVPAYLLAGLRLGSLPLFDDLDADRLRTWVASNQPAFAAALPPKACEQLNQDVERLIAHDANWKQSEPALGRHPLRLLSSDFRSRFKSRVLDSWSRREVVDPCLIGQMRGGERFFTSLTFLLGLIPGRVGRFFQQVWANTLYRNRVKRWLGDSQYRNATLSALVTRKTAQWRAAGRLAEREIAPVSSLVFTTHWLLAKITPITLHRWLADPVYRQNRQTRMFLFCVSGKFQREIGQFFIRARIEAWQKEQRLNAAEAARLRSQLDTEAMEEYVRGFGLHVGLKLLLPIVMSLKVGGAAASVASGNPFYFLFMLMLVPILRTAVTLWRMAATGRPVADYRDALLVGILPVVGSLAYPVQMHCKFPDLSQFLLRDFASRVGRWLPIYGGKDSRTEITAIASINIIAELLEVWSSITRSGRWDTNDSSPIVATAVNEKISTIAIGRWDRLVREQLRMIALENDVEPQVAVNLTSDHLAREAA